jgi:uncharacterized membrane protein YkoI
MKTLIGVISAASLLLATNLAFARDLSHEEAQQLRDSGAILSTEALSAAALAQHPGGTLEDQELEEEYGRYVYQAEIRDQNGGQWDLELDAGTGQVLKNHRDD